METILKDNEEHIKRVNNVYAPINDKYNYKVERLDNGLIIFFVGNDKSKISSANMYVNVGSCYNPDDCLGLAHYLEHMLFMGSDLYKGGDYFHQKVTENGGSSNAFTMEDNTQYYFDAGKNFEFLLEVFSRFFIAPEFNIKYVEKEVSAVNSEHNKNIGSDEWRMMNLAKNFFTDGINSKFSTGTNKTLLGHGNPSILREKLIEFYNKYYNADRMVLFVFHNDLSDRFIDKICKMFRQIKSGNSKDIDNTATVRTMRDNTVEIFKMKKNNEGHHMSVSWLINGYTEYKNNICIDGSKVLMYILGHEGIGSIHHILKEKGYIIDLFFGKDMSFKRNYVLSFHIDFTDLGMRKWESVLSIINEYIKNILSECDKLYDIFNEEVEKINYLDLKTIEKTNGIKLVQKYADIYSGTKISPEYIPIYSLFYGDNKKHFKEILNTMAKIENYKIILASSSFRKLKKRDEYYGTHYDIYEYEMITKSENIKNIYPRINEYLPCSNTIKIIDPIKKDDSDYQKIYSDNLYYIQRGNVYKTFDKTGIITIELESMKDYNPDIYIIVGLYILYVSHMNNSETYMMESARIFIDIEFSTTELSIYFDTGCDDIVNVFEKVMSWFFIHDKPLDEIVFKRLYDEMMKDLLNYDYSDPYTIIVPEFRKLVNPKYTISNDQLIKSLKNLSKKDSKKDFITKAKEYISYGSIVGVMGGSLKLRQAEEIIDIIDNLVKRPTINKNLVKYDLSIPRKFNGVKENLNKDNTEKAIGYGIYLGNIKQTYVYDLSDDKCEEWILNISMMHMMETYVSNRFSSLVRTEKEVGYIAMCNLVNVSESNNSDYFLLFIVQSSRNDLVNIVEDYINNHMMKDIDDISDEQFNNMKQSILTHYMEEHVNARRDIVEKMSIIQSRTIYRDDTDDFIRKKRFVKCIKLIDYNMFRKYVGNINNNPKGYIQILPLKD